LRARLQAAPSTLQSGQQPAEFDKSRDVERRFDEMKMSYDQQILDLQAIVCSCAVLVRICTVTSLPDTDVLQKYHAIENNRSFAQGLEVGQQKLVSALNVAQSQIVELRNALVEKDRALSQLRHDAQQSVRSPAAALAFKLPLTRTILRRWLNPFKNWRKPTIICVSNIAFWKGDVPRK
jgi:hypothetical protein